MESRRTVFSALFDDFKEVTLLIGSLPEADLIDPTSIVRPLSAMSATVNKVWLWSTVETAYLVRALQTETAELFLDAIPKAGAIHNIRRTIEKGREIANQFRFELEKSKEQISDLRLKKQEAFGTDPTIAPKMSMLNDNFARASKGLDDCLDDISRDEQYKAKLRSEYGAFVGERQLKLMGRISEVLKSARNELGVEGDTQLLDIQTLEIQKRVREAIATTLKPFSK